MASYINSVRLKTGFSTYTNLNFKYGLTIKDFLNQDINTGFLVVPDSPELDIEPFDVIEITYETIKILRMYVGTINASVSKFGDTQANNRYTYNIGLVSLTTKLQRIVLPNRSITNSLDGNSDWTIKEVINNYLSMYTDNITISSALNLKLGTTVCPESQWNRPTLFEVLVDLFKPLGIVPFMETETSLSFLDLDTDGNEINQSVLNGLEFSHDIREYASDFEIDASNVYDINNIVRTPEFLVPKTEEQQLMTSNNQAIILQKPIFEIDKVILKLYYNTQPQAGQLNTYAFYDLDITDRVVNKKVWDTFFSSKDPGHEPDTSTKKYQRNYLYYETGDNKIQGLNFNEDNWSGISQLFGIAHKALTNVAKYELEEIGTNQTTTIVNELVSSGKFDGLIYDTVGFLVEYKTNENMLFRVKKETGSRNKSTLISQQENSSVNLKEFAKKQQETINRSGNKEMIVTGKFENFADIPALNDYIGDYILYNREIQFNKGFYNFKGMLGEYYSKENIFAGINTQRRFTSIASESEALVSHHITEENLKISNIDYDNDSHYNRMENYLISNFGKTNYHIQGALLSTDQTDTGEVNDRLLMETSIHKVGKSFTVTMNMKDNFNVAYKLESTGGFTSEKMMQYIPYVDNDGRFENIQIQLLKWDPNYANRGLSIENFYVTQDGYLYNFVEGLDVAEKFPAVQNTQQYSQGVSGNTPILTTYQVVKDAGIIYKSGSPNNQFLDRYKDNREITYETVQFFISEDTIDTTGSHSTRKVFITDRFFDFLPVFCKADLSFRIYYSTTAQYTRTSRSGIGNHLTGNIAETTGTTKLNLVDNKIEIANRGTFTAWSNVRDNILSYAICDNYGKILLAVNKTATTYEPLYLNKRF